MCGAREGVRWRGEGGGGGGEVRGLYRDESFKEVSQLSIRRCCVVGGEDRTGQMRSLR